MVRRTRAGYTLLVLAVFISVLTVGLLIALPVWETQVRREAEEELIFRGRQVVEAVRVFVVKNPGSFPKSLDELVKGRYLRRAYSDPMTRDGRWTLILQGGQPSGSSGEGGAPGATQQLLLVPQTSLSAVQSPRLIGVVSSSTRTSIRILDEKDTYDTWLFYYGQTPGAEPEIVRFGQPVKRP